MGESDPVVCVEYISNGKRHRTEAETARVDNVLAGDMDIFIEAELEML